MGRSNIAFLSFSLIVLAFCLSQSVAAQVSPMPTPTPSLEREFFKNILRDQKAIWTAPASLTKSDLKWAVPSAVGALALVATDRTTGDEMAEFESLKGGSRIVSNAGSLYGVAAIASSFYIAGRKRNDYRSRETGILIAEASVNTLIVSSALKAISQRGRPEVGRERSEFFEGGNSFPSGHSAQAWAVATVIANEYRHRRLVKVAAYGVASAVSVARFTGGKHYLSDVLIGSALGFGIGRYVFQAHHRAVTDVDTSDNSRDAWPLIETRYSRGRREYGLALTWKF